MAGKKNKKDKKAEKKARKAAKKAKKAREAARQARAAAGNKPALPKTARPAAARTKAARAQHATATKPAAAPKPRQQPETLRLHAAGPSLTVGDLQRSLAFYCDLLRFTVSERWEQDGELRGVELVAGRVRFWLAQDDWKKGRDRVKGQGFRIYCTTTQNVDAIAERLRAAGVTLLQEPQDQPWGGREFAVADPDGFVLSIASQG